MSSFDYEQQYENAAGKFQYDDHGFRVASNGTDHSYRTRSTNASESGRQSEEYFNYATFGNDSYAYRGYGMGMASPYEMESMLSPQWTPDTHSHAFPRRFYQNEPSTQVAFSKNAVAGNETEVPPPPTRNAFLAKTGARYSPKSLSSSTPQKKKSPKSQVSPKSDGEQPKLTCRQRHNQERARRFREKKRQELLVRKAMSALEK